MESTKSCYVRLIFQEEAVAKRNFVQLEKHPLAFDVKMDEQDQRGHVVVISVHDGEYEHAREIAELMLDSDKTHGSKLCATHVIIETMEECWSESTDEDI